MLSAEERAEALLIYLLGFQEWWGLKTSGYVDIQSPSVRTRYYRIRRPGGMIGVWENGQLTEKLCIDARFSEHLPTDDVVAVHVLMLRANEAQYLRLANHFPAR